MTYKAEEAAGLLLKARAEVKPLSALPSACKPSTLEEAYDAQEALVRQRGEAIVAYKVGATAALARQALNIDHPFSGQVAASALLQSPLQMSSASMIFRLIEPEFAFRFGQDLPPKAGGYESDEVAAAADCLFPAIEVVTSGLDNWMSQGIQSIIADNGVNGALVLGAPCEDWRSLDLANHRVSLTINGENKGDGVGANVIGLPISSLTWEVNHLSSRGVGIKKGQIITTGVVTPFHLAEGGDKVVADYGSLGQVVIQFD